MDRAQYLNDLGRHQIGEQHIVGSAKQETGSRSLLWKIP